MAGTFASSTPGGRAHRRFRRANQEWRTSWIYNAVLLEGTGDEILKLSAPASASELEAVIREMATAMKNAGYNLRIGVINFDADALALGTQQFGGIGNAAVRVVQEAEALCVVP